DKTGTLTEGNPAVTDIMWSPSVKNNIQELSGILLSIESQSEHPLAEAVVRYLKNNLVAPPGGVPVSGLESITGKGVQATVDGVVYFAGSNKMINELNIAVHSSLQQPVNRWEAEAKTVIYFSRNN